MTELVPVSNRLSTIQPQYVFDDPQTISYTASRQQIWTTDTSQTQTKPAADSLSGANKQQFIVLFLVGTLIGLVICGVPLAVMATLYSQAKSSNNTSSSSSSGSSSSSLPSQCTTYTLIADNTRNIAYLGGSSYCDSGLSTGWYRFIGSAGTQLTMSPTSQGMCGATYTGWFNGSLPTTSGSSTTGTVCLNYGGSICYSSYSITSVQVTNCDTFYVYYLRGFSICNSRYCTQ